MRIIRVGKESDCFSRLIYLFIEAKAIQWRETIFFKPKCKLVNTDRNGHLDVVEHAKLVKKVIFFFKFSLFSRVLGTFVPKH